MRFAKVKAHTKERIMAIKSELQHFYEKNLVCPYTNEALTFDQDIIVTASGKKYSFKNQIPCFLNSLSLTNHQSSELEWHRKHITEILNSQDPNISAERLFEWPESNWKWTEKWLNSNTVKPDTKIVCIGGAFADDVPHVHSNYKFNVDHLAHEYVKLTNKILEANTHYIACVSEKMPFCDNYADFVYSRNSLDHVSNPIQTLQEIYRILKPGGKFLLAVYYSSNIINRHESTSVDDEFIISCINPLFATEHSFISSAEGGELFMVCQKKADGVIPFTQEQVKTVGEMLSCFHSALYCEETNKVMLAAQNYVGVLGIEPVLRTDFMRVMYSLIRLYGITDHVRFNTLKQLFEKVFGLSNSFSSIFERTIVDYDIQLSENLISNDVSYCVKILDDPARIEGKKILQYFVKLAEGYLNKPDVERIRQLISESVMA